MRERNLAHTPTADRRRFTLEFGRPCTVCHLQTGRHRPKCARCVARVRCNVVLSLTSYSTHS
ncbi:hypothetical protein J6590_041955 [Homalodisca vitripennis]|nr:hypothetical protein J6590_041955 [Homalodisca vitripennis]